MNAGWVRSRRRAAGGDRQRPQGGGDRQRDERGADPGIGPGRGPGADPAGGLVPQQRRERSRHGQVRAEVQAEQQPFGMGRAVRRQQYGGGKVVDGHRRRRSHRRRRGRPRPGHQPGGRRPVGCQAPEPHGDPVDAGQRRRPDRLHDRRNREPPVPQPHRHGGQSHDQHRDGGRRHRQHQRGGDARRHRPQRPADRRPSPADASGGGRWRQWRRCRSGLPPVSGGNPLRLPEPAAGAAGGRRPGRPGQAPEEDGGRGGSERQQGGAGPPIAAVHRPILPVAAALAAIAAVTTVRWTRSGRAWIRRYRRDGDGAADPGRPAVDAHHCPVVPGRIGSNRRRPNRRSSTAISGLRNAGSAPLRRGTG